MNKKSVNEYLTPTIEVESMDVECGFALSVGGSNEDMGDLEEL